ncbi:hypothetical protein MJT46_012656 [Ovis ammon polii x Ovis aries]|nr:hypothetical protein MJT46_012656 [Ovis ammon polii x Ovis aries]
MNQLLLCLLPLGLFGRVCGSEKNHHMETQTRNVLEELTGLLFFLTAAWRQVWFSVHVTGEDIGVPQTKGDPAEGLAGKMKRDHPWTSTREFTLKRSSMVLAYDRVDRYQGTEALGASVFSLFVKEGSDCTGPLALSGCTESLQSPVKTSELLLDTGPPLGTSSNWY